MAVFEYYGRDAQGKSQRGKLSAASVSAVANQLLKHNIMPISIQEIKSRRSLFKFLDKKLFPHKVKTEELIIFCRQMYTLTNAGVPILKGLARLKESVRSQALAEVLQGVLGTISSGQSFTAALRKYPEVFPPIFINTVDAGENGGQLEEAFSRLADYLELEARTAKQLKAAGRYPTIVFTVICIAFVVINFMVIPAFAKLFKQFGAQLPLPTRILIGTSNFLISHWLFLLILVIIFVVSIRYYVRTPQGGYLWDKYRLKIPILGPLSNRIILSRFARTFAMVIRSGVPLMHGIELVANAVGNDFVKGRVLTMGEAIEHGESITQTAIASGMFSPLVIQMLSVGEESGKVDTLLIQVAEFYEQEVDYDLKRLGELIEPIMLIMMACLVLILAMGVFLPMWDMATFARMQ